MALNYRFDIESGCRYVGVQLTRARYIHLLFKRQAYVCNPLEWGGRYIGVAHELVRIHFES